MSTVSIKVSAAMYQAAKGVGARKCAFAASSTADGMVMSFDPKGFKEFISFFCGTDWTFQNTKTGDKHSTLSFDADSLTKRPVERPTLEQRKVAKALGINAGNIARVERLWNGCNIHYKNAQAVYGRCDSRMLRYAHHTQVARYRNVPLSKIVFGCETEMTD